MMHAGKCLKVKLSNSNDRLHGARYRKVKGVYQIGHLLLFFLGQRRSYNKYKRAVIDTVSFRFVVIEGHKYCKIGLEDKVNFQWALLIMLKPKSIIRYT